MTCPGPPTSGLCADCPACWEGCPAHSPGPHCESPPLRVPPRLSSGPTLRLSSGPGHCLPGHPVLTISNHFFQFSFHCFSPSPHRCARPVRTGAWFWNVHSGREGGSGAILIPSKGKGPMPSSCGARGYGLPPALLGRWAWVAGTVLQDILGSRQEARRVGPITQVQRQILSLCWSL